MNIEPNTTIGGRYTIIEKIGVGGMAVVYKAMDKKLNRYVTFKVLKEEHIENEEFINRFAVEAQAAARISHPNIVNVYDVGNDGDIYYIVMEYIDGITLKELINRKAPFDNQEALSVAIQIASALEEAHKNNIVHRDIKPHNILVTKDGDIKVTDFGIARAATSTTVTVESMGSVHYFSPEQARGGYVDSKSDIYSLGIVLFEMVTGRLPFQGDTTVALAMKHIKEPIPDVRRINPDVSESVYRIIIKATQKSSARRYQTIEDMNRDLKRATKNDFGDFVVFEEEDVTSQTIRVTGEELDEIKKQSQNTRSDYDDYDDYDDYKPQNNVTLKNDKSNKVPSGYYSNYNKENEKKKNKQVVIAAVGTALVLIMAITVAAYAFFGGEKGNVEVPNFTGKTWEEALKLAKDKKLYLAQDKDKAEDYSDEFVEGLIMKQNLEEGSFVDEGDTVYVVMSLGSDKIDVPSVVGDNIDDAMAELKKNNIKWSEEWEYNEEVEKTKVIKQEPEAGEKISRDSKVTLYVSRGRESDGITVPDVVGKSESSAKSTLSSKGFSVEVERVESSRDAGYVVDQSIQAGETREEGTSVIIYVSRGRSNSYYDDNDDYDNNSNNRRKNNNEEENKTPSRLNKPAETDQNNSVGNDEKPSQGNSSDSSDSNNTNNNSGDNGNTDSGNNSSDSNNNSDNNNNNDEKPVENNENANNENHNNVPENNGGAVEKTVEPKKVDEVEIDPNGAV